jgi:hypothetical protein
MGKANKIGIILILVGICLPTVTLPFISEFHPLPDVCLTSNFFHNMGNMEIVLRSEQVLTPDNPQRTNYQEKIAIPYRYLFALGVILACAGIGTIVLSRDKKD